MKNDVSADQLWLTGLLLSKAVATALVKQNILKKDDILNELASIKADENIILSNAIKDAEAAIQGIITGSTPQDQ